MTASDARSLATRLAQLDAGALADLFAARHVPTDAAWHDFFDAADALLDPVSIGRALVELTLGDVEALAPAVEADGAVDGPTRDRLAALALVDADGHPYRAVTAVFRETDRIDVATPQAAPAGSAGPDADAHSAEQAFAVTASLADIVVLADRTPLGRIGSGALSAGDRRRLLEAGAVEDAADADGIVAIAQAAGLLAATERHWLRTDAAAQWLRRSTADRWFAVAVALRDTLPPALRSGDGGWIPPSTWPLAHPFDPAWPARAEGLRRLWRRWGLLNADDTTPAWAAELGTGDVPDPSALRALLPQEVSKVYLQNDLTAIAPGPLASELDIRLRGMARRESRAQAATYRFTADTIGAALTAGETAESLTAFLTELSLTGVPQPLAYEIERGAARHGAVRVGPDSHGRARVSGDPDLLEAIAVDQGVRALGLIRDGATLVSRTNPEAVFWILADARYPVLAVDEHGAPRVLDRHPAVPAPEPAPPPRERYAALMERLHASDGADADAAWMERELEQAVRARANVSIVVRMPDGSTREVTVEAAGLSGGRLRGRDRAADVERTLPVASIVSVRPV